MNDACRDICALVHSIAETVSVSGRGCPVDLRVDEHCDVRPGCACRGMCSCCEFISASAGPCVKLIDAVIEPARTRAGSCLRASLSVPVTVTVRMEGVNRACRGEICIPVEGHMRGGPGPYNELVAQANVRVCRGCYQDGRMRLWVDFQADVHAICLRAVRLPTLGPCGPVCGESCHPFFNLPLYPQG